MKRTVAIAANFTIEPISATLEKYFSRLGVDHEVQFAPFDQIFQQLIDPSSSFHKNRSGVNAIFLRLENLLDPVENGLENLDALLRALKRSEDLNVPLFLFICAHSDAALSCAALAKELVRAERILMDLTRSCRNLSVFGYQALLAQFRIDKYDNPIGDSLARVSYAGQYYSALGIELVRRSDAVFRRPHKVLVLDCDNTLWDGVCGEDGTNGIEFPEYRIALQQLAVEQSKAGMVVCLCSKNNEPDVWDVFDRRKEMRLTRDHLVSWRINWESKSINLRSLANELQLGLDSFIFVDDDPAVCAEVRENCPEVFTLLLPKDPREISNVLKHIWLFDRQKITKEDEDRSQSYLKEAARKSVQRESPNLESFLQDLQLVCEIEEMRPEQATRVSQLSLRTNQFNSTTKRRSESDIKRLASEPNKHVLTVNVRDRFGDYGLVGAVICRMDANALYTDAFLLSCRALGRGVEHQILRYLGSIAASAGFEYVDIEFIRSEKNTPIFAFLNQLNDSLLRQEDGRTIYRISTETAVSANPLDKIVDSDEEVPNVAIVFQEAKTVVDCQVYSEIAYELMHGMRSDSISCPSVLDRDLLSSPFEGPRTETERLLLRIWESQLHFSNIGVLDNYFELGGDSLLAVSLFVEIEGACRCRLPLSVLIGSPTVASLAAHIDGRSTSTPSGKYLVPIQESGNQRPLYCMHAAGGNVLFYRDLSRELGTDQPVYGLQARGIADNCETAHERVEEMAADYLNEIRSHQRSGPYRLCGSSFGGLVAFEIARQLADVGETVELLAMFDTYAPGFLKTLGETSRPNIFESLYLRYRNTRDQVLEIKSTSARIDFIKNRLAKLIKQIRRRATWRKNQFALEYAKATGQDLPKDMQRNHKAIDRALESYVPSGTYEGQFVLFRAENRPAGITSDSRLGWDKFTNSPIEIIDVKGSHGALTVYPFAADLAAKFKPFIAEKNTNFSQIPRFATAA